VHLDQRLRKPQRDERAIDDNACIEAVSVFVGDDERLFLLCGTVWKDVSAKFEEVKGGCNVPFPQELPGIFNGFLRSRPDNGAMVVSPWLNVAVVG